MDESRPRYEATIEAIIRLWTERDVTEDTPYFSFHDANSLPHPVQRPHPPVWGAAVRSPESFTWLAKKGFGVMLALAPDRQYTGLSRHLVDHYREVFTATHGDSATPRVAMSTPLYVAATDDEAYEIAEPLYHEYFRVWAEAAQSWKNTTSTGYVGYEAMGRDMGNLASFDVKRNGTAVIGSPESVVDQIHQLHETYGADTYLWNVDFGAANYEQMEASLRLFVDRVLPKL
jgi:alkanesulfonate monooxygenase SsuD/methylene tetrahydromethanopterin reductase-like flavin-dependent oxidoreductase (luciferase family)